MSDLISQLVDGETIFNIPDDNIDCVIALNCCLSRIFDKPVINFSSIPCILLNLSSIADSLSSFCFSDSRVSEYASYVNTILHLAQNFPSGLLGSLQLGHCFGLSSSDS